MFSDWSIHSDSSPLIEFGVGLVAPPGGGGVNAASFRNLTTTSPLQKILVNEKLGDVVGTHSITAYVRVSSPVKQASIGLVALWDGIESTSTSGIVLEVTGFSGVPLLSLRKGPDRSGAVLATGTIPFPLDTWVLIGLGVTYDALANQNLLVVRDFVDEFDPVVIPQTQAVFGGRTGFLAQSTDSGYVLSLDTFNVQALSI